MCLMSRQQVLFSSCPGKSGMVCLNNEDMNNKEHLLYYGLENNWINKNWINTGQFAYINNKVTG